MALDTVCTVLQPTLRRHLPQVRRRHLQEEFSIRGKESPNTRFWRLPDKRPRLTVGQPEVVAVTWRSVVVDRRQLACRTARSEGRPNVHRCRRSV